jgi:PAS domain S-box-containing protein/putative nucleotidyltransferase with HDIG domain
MLLKRYLASRTFIVYSLLGVIVFVLGLRLIYWSRSYHDQVKKNGLLQQASPLANAINVQILDQLLGDNVDRELELNQLIKDQWLTARDMLYPNVDRFDLIIKDSQGNLVIISSTEEPGNLVSGQGLIESPPELLQVFSTAKGTVIGPLSDQNGAWIKIYLPLLDTHTHEVSAIWAMDIDAKHWNQEIREDLKTPATYIGSAVLFSWVSLLVLALRKHSLNKLRQKKGSRYALVLLSVLIGTSFTALLIWYGWYFENNFRRDSFQRLVSSRASMVFSILQNVESSSLSGLEKFFESSEFVSRQEFHDFSKILWKGSAVVSEWAWIPEVPQAELADLVKTTRAEGLSNFFVFEKDVTGNQTPVADRPVYYPVLYSESTHSNSIPLGFDLGSAETPRSAIVDAMESGLAMTADSIWMGSGSINPEGLFLYKPVYADKYGKRQVGVVSAKIQPEELVYLIQGFGNYQETVLHLDFYQLFYDREPSLLASTLSQHGTNDIKPFGKPAKTDLPDRVPSVSNLSGSNMPCSMSPKLTLLDLTLLDSTSLANALLDMALSCNPLQQNDAELPYIQPVFIFGKVYAVLFYPGEDFNLMLPERFPGVLGLSGIVLTVFFVGLVASYTNRDLYLSDLVAFRTKELQESEQKFQMALRNSPIVVFQQDLALRYQWLYNPNPYFDPAELIGKRDDEYFPPDQAANLVRIKQKALESGIGEREIVYLCVAGEPAYYDLMVEPQRDEQGRLFGVACSAVNITERIQYERQITDYLEHSKRMYEITQYNAKDTHDLLDFAMKAAIELTQSQVGYIYLFDKIEQKFCLANWSTRELQGCEILDASSLHEMGEAGLWEQVISQGQPVIVNCFEAEDNDPTAFASLERFVSVPVLSNQEIAAVVILANSESDYGSEEILELTLLADLTWKIVEHTKAEEIKALQATALEAAANAIFITDANGVVEWSNQAWSELSGYRMEEIVGEKPKILVSGEYELGFYKHLLRTIKSGHAWRSEMINRRKDGSYYHSDATITPVKGEDGRNTHYIVVVQDVTTRKRSEEKLVSQASEIRHKNLQLERLYRSSQTLLAGTTTLGMRQLGQLMIDLVSQELKAETGCLFEIHQKNYTLSLLARRSKDQSILLGDTIQLDEVELLADVIASKQGRYIPDLTKFPIPLHCPVACLGNNRSVMLAPLGDYDETFALLALMSPEIDHFDEDDFQLFSLYAAECAVVLNNARLLAQIREQVSRLESLRVIDEAISASLDLGEIADTVLLELKKQLHADAVQFMRYDPESASLTSVKRIGFHPASSWGKSGRFADIPLGEGLSGLAAKSKELTHLDDLDQTKQQLQQNVHLADNKFVEYYGIPLIFNGNLKGLLELYNCKRVITNDSWFDYLKTAAGQAAIAVENTEMINELENSIQELRKAYDENIRGWSRALDLRDKETEGHTLRVERISCQLASHFGITGDELMYLRWGALLHDIGKMGIPDHILLKPGPLTDDEWRVMRTHPVKAFELLNSISFLKPALDIPYYHHEKWDGSGYPLGLKGEQIPLAARIFAIADVWDALCSDRPYRPAWTEEKAIAYVQDQAGSHFDPEVVKTFLEIYKNEPQG